MIDGRDQTARSQAIEAHVNLTIAELSVGRSQHALNLTTRNFPEGTIKIIQLAATTDV